MKIFNLVCFVGNTFFTNEITVKANDLDDAVVQATQQFGTFITVVRYTTEEVYDTVVVFAIVGPQWGQKTEQKYTAHGVSEDEAKYFAKEYFIYAQGFEYVEINSTYCK